MPFQQKYTKEFEEFTEWYFADPGDRVIPTQVEWAKAHGVSVQALAKWVKKIKKNTVSSQDDMETFVAHLKERIYNGTATAKDKELYAKINGWLIERKEVTERFEPSASDYIAYGRRVIEQLRENYSEHGGVCPVCGGLETLCLEPRSDTEPEHEESRELATVAVSSGTD